jgi:hypothetical protein
MPIFPGAQLFKGKDVEGFQCFTENEASLGHRSDVHKGKLDFVWPGSARTVLDPPG